MEGSSLIIGEEPEFYTVCNLVLSSHFQNEACELVQRVGLNPILVESSNLMQHVSLLIRESRDRNTLTNLLNVILISSKHKYFACFRYIVPKLKELVRGKDETLQCLSFLCFSNFIAQGVDVDRNMMFDMSCVLIHSDNREVRLVCCYFVEEALEGCCYFVLFISEDYERGK